MPFSGLTTEMATFTKDKNKGVYIKQPSKLHICFPVLDYAILKNSSSAFKSFIS